MSQNSAEQRATASHAQELHAQEIRTQQARLFHHLSKVLTQLCERVPWQDLDGREQRRLKRSAAALSSSANLVLHTLDKGRSKQGSGKVLRRLPRR